MIKRHVRRFLTFPRYRQAVEWLVTAKDGDYGALDIPHWCQFATPEKTREMLEGEMDLRDDPAWRVFGYETIDSKDNPCIQGVGFQG